MSVGNAVLIIISIILLIIIYAVCVKLCCDYFEEKDIEANIITILMASIPILNFIIALRAVNWDDVKRIFKSDKTLE